MADPYMISVKEAMEMADFSRAYIYKLMAQNKFRTGKIGKSRRIYWDSFKKFLDKSEQKV